MGNLELHKARAQHMAESDFKAGLACDPAKHGAHPASAWSNWYIERFVLMKEQALRGTQEQKNLINHPAH